MRTFHKTIINIEKSGNEHNQEVRNLVLAGLEQVYEGKTKDFNAVCDRLEKKYMD